MGTDTQVEHPVVFFDGVCNLCNATVQFIIKRDRAAFFRFASLQSDYAAKALPSHLNSGEQLPSLVLQTGSKTQVKSTAALNVARRLSGLWPVLYVFIVIPPFIRHFFYDLIAKNRYKLFGKQDQCMVPSPEFRDRFIG